MSSLVCTPTKPPSIVASPERMASKKQILSKEGSPPSPSSLTPTASVPALTKAILEVFPDCSKRHARRMINRFDCSCFYHLQAVLDAMAKEGYERDEEDEANEGEGDLEVCRGLGVSRKRIKDYDGYSWKTSGPYRDEAVKLLAAQLPFASAEEIQRVFQNFKFRYGKIVEGIGQALGMEKCKLVMSGGIIDWDLLSQTNKIKLNEMGFRSSPLAKTVVSDKRGGKFRVSNHVLSDEIDYYNSKFAEKQESSDASYARVLARENAQEIDGLIECNCCFEEVAFEEMSQCCHGCLFCNECLRRYTEEHLFGVGGYIDRIKCMGNGANGEKCTGYFEEDMLKRALPKKILDKLYHEEFRKAMDNAKVKNLTECPNCGFVAVVEDRVFRCPALGCGHVSCRVRGGEGGAKNAALNGELAVVVSIQTFFSLLVTRLFGYFFLFSRAAPNFWSFRCGKSAGGKICGTFLI